MTFDEFKRAVIAAEQLSAQGQRAAALSAFTDVVRSRLAACQKADNLADADLVVIRRLADLAVSSWETQAAGELLAALEELHGRQGTVWAADFARIKRLHLALAANRLGDAEQALRSLEPSLRLGTLDFSSRALLQWESRLPWPSERRPLLLAQAYLGMGGFLAALGRYAEALSLLRRGVAVAAAAEPDSPAREAELPLRLAAAAAALEHGDLARAIEEAAPLAAVDERRHLGIAVGALQLRAKGHILRGEVAPAVEQLQQALAACARLSDERAWFHAGAFLTEVRILANQVSTDDELLAQLEAAAQRSGDAELRQEAELLRQLSVARIGFLSGADLADPVTRMQEAVEPTLDAKGPRPAVVVRAGARQTSLLATVERRGLALQIAMEERRWKAAAELLAEAERLCEESDSPLLHSLLGLWRGMFTYYEGICRGDPSAPAGAREAFEAVRPHLLALGLLPDLYKLLSMLAGCLRRLAAPEPERETVVRDRQHVLDQIVAALPEGWRDGYVINKWRADEEALAFQIDALERLRAREAGASLSLSPLLRLRWRWRLVELLERIHRQRESMASHATGAAELPRPSRVWRLWWRLLLQPRDRATLAFLVLPDRTFLACLAGLSAGFGVARINRRAIREEVRAWHRQSCAGPNLVGNDAKRTAVRLSGELGVGAAVAELPRRIRRLTVLPDDVLHGFPFAALPSLGRFAISIGYETAPRRRPPRPAPRRALVTAVANPGSPWQDLPGAREEVRAVAALMRRDGVSLAADPEGEATLELVLAELPRVDFCHLACHGTFHPNDPDQTGLVLVRGGVPQVLTLRQLGSLSLGSLRHVTLSSCWAADNYVLPGRWVISLPELFCRRGAASVLACLWQVGDDTAVTLSRLFYRASRRLPLDRALRFAQRQLRRGLHTSDPYEWAGFQLYGDPGRLTLGSAAGVAPTSLSMTP